MNKNRIDRFQRCSVQLQTYGLSLLLFSASLSFAFAQRNDPYPFPVKPGTKEWTELKTYDERLKAYTIPADILNQMTTQALVQTCLNYPELRLITTRNDLQTGYSYIKSIFNGLEELEKRKDAGKELLAAYNRLNPADITKYSSLAGQGSFLFQFIHLELFLAQRSILANLQTGEKKELVRRCIANFETGEKMPSHYTLFELKTPVWVVSRILEADNNADFLQKKADNPGQAKFLANSSVTDKSILTDVISISKKYLND